MPDKLLTLVQLADRLTAAGAGDAVPRDRLDAADDLRGLARAAFRRPTLPDRLTEKNVAAAARDYATALAAADRANQASAAVETALAKDVRAAFREAVPAIDRALRETFTAAAAVATALAADVAGRGPADLVAAGADAVADAARYSDAVALLDAVAVARAELAEVLDLPDRRTPPPVRFLDADLDRDTLRLAVERFGSPAPSSPHRYRPDLRDRWARMLGAGAVLMYQDADTAAATWQRVTTREQVTA